MRAPIFLFSLLSLLVAGMAVPAPCVSNAANLQAYMNAVDASGNVDQAKLGTATIGSYAARCAIVNGQVLGC